jgi:Zn-dependent alcohol dehydrogenase
LYVRPPRTVGAASVSLPGAAAREVLKLDELVTRRYRLDQINEAITDMREGRNIRGIIEFD